MTHKQFNAFCSNLPHTTYVMQWGGSHVWKIGGKVFAIGFARKDRSPAFTFKASENNYYFLREKEGYQPAPYFASRGMKWIQQFDEVIADKEELEYYIMESYRMVAQGLTKKVRRELGLSME
ncbi:MmcQ/YjbR family DNA-binding protein [uncultured Endozoicomonas sp.]|uniref:MmcQ/YjbR family DNA-binding protein n=1 Tax=uncultured Endozoicomonas sp. TaxID=432652 RepID=UPI002625D8D0|nr:MmcQ/YjbR family DNA-binding protein [uncultured Endozoicomonas sp.]